jgi:hypothetical protein
MVFREHSDPLRTVPPASYFTLNAAHKDGMSPMYTGHYTTHPAGMVEYDGHGSSILMRAWVRPGVYDASCDEFSHRPGRDFNS